MRLRLSIVPASPILLGCLCAPAALAAQTGSPPDSAVRAILEQRVASGRSAGIVVGLLAADGTARFFTAGEAGPGKRPLDRNSVFEIGSVTKVFTGTLLADMSIAGDVALDDPVREHLPAGVTMPSRNGIEITLAHLAAQTSALPRLPTNFRPANMADPYADYTADRLYEFLSGYALTRDPGAQYEYSNVGVGLLGHVLSLVAGEPYGELVRQRILDPLGMAHTGIALTPWMRAHIVAGHNALGDTVPLWDMGVLAGAGALRSDAEDMLAFLGANVRPDPGRLGRAMMLAHAPRAGAGSPAMAIGLAWHRLNLGGDTLVWHNGGTGGFRSFAGFRPSTGAAVVVLTNSGGQGSDDIGFHLLNSAFPLEQPERGDPGRIRE
ncbi:MAG: serine hydrolase domain-containing protein [Gemmatimonadota bacterium]|jgi:CubicO group peptidase (beta-lactamase class C family)